MWLFKLFMLVVAKSQLQHLADEERRYERTLRQSGQRNDLPFEVTVLHLYTCSLKGEKGFTAKHRGNCHFKKNNKSQCLYFCVLWMLLLFSCLGQILKFFTARCTTITVKQWYGMKFLDIRLHPTVLKRVKSRINFSNFHFKTRLSINFVNNSTCQLFFKVRYFSFYSITTILQQVTDIIPNLSIPSTLSCGCFGI